MKCFIKIYSNNYGSVVPVSKKIIFNSEQKKAIIDIRMFLKSNKKYYNLRGKGGTGKTTVIAGAMTGFTNIIGVTISHRAKERLKYSIKDCFTFASACGMKVVTNSLGNKVFVVNKYAKKQPIKYADYIIIDECSMISKSSIKLIERLKKPSAIVIYMGDFRQLPPIDGGGLDSRTFSIPDSFDLTVAIRQGIGNPILEVSNSISKEIESKNFNPYVINNFLKDKLNDKGKGYCYLDNSNFIDDFISDFKKDDSTRFICFRKNTVSKYNKIIRKSIYKGTTDVYIKGELIIAYQSYYRNDEELLKNSLEYYIEEVNLGTSKGFESYLISFKNVDRIVPVLTKKGEVAFNKELQYLSMKFRWNKFWELKESFADIDYGYAINSHKSQGSTYKNVYLDFNDVLTVSRITDKEKCQSLNVIITRASHKLVLLDL